MTSLGQLFRTDEAAAYLRVDVQTVRRWVKEGRLPALKAGHQLVYTEEALKAFLEPAGAAPKT
jgi:excisionase family DNA binding protein